MRAQRISNCACCLSAFLSCYHTTLQHTTTKSHIYCNTILSRLPLPSAPGVWNLCSRDTSAIVTCKKRGESGNLRIFGRNLVQAGISVPWIGSLESRLRLLQSNASLLQSNASLLPSTTDGIEVVLHQTCLGCSVLQSVAVCCIVLLQ